MLQCNDGNRESRLLVVPLLLVNGSHRSAQMLKHVRILCPNEPIFEFIALVSIAFRPTDM